MSYCIPCESIGSVPRSLELIGVMTSDADATVKQSAFHEAVVDSLRRMEDAVDGADPSAIVITDGEQTKPSFVTYPIAKLTNLASNGAVIPFVDGHTRHLPALTSGPFRYSQYAVDYFIEAKKLLPNPDRKLKQAVISASAMMLLYPAGGLEGYSQTEFIDDCVAECTKDIRLCLDAGADVVQMDMTEARLSLKLDPSGGLLKTMLAVNNRVFSSFSAEQRLKLGIHVCPGADRDSTHSADVDYVELLPLLLTSLSCNRFYLELKAEADPTRALTAIKENIKVGQMIFVGVIDVNNPRVETAEEVAAFIAIVAEYIPIHQLGACDDCGFAPFADDESTARDIAFAKIKARVEGCKLAGAQLLGDK